jgi:SAM-dependent methyltransferase
MSFPSIGQRYDIEFSSSLYGDEEFIKKELSDLSNSVGIDFACGTGRTLDLLGEKCKKLYMFDNDESMLLRLREKANKSAVLCRQDLNDVCLDHVNECDFALLIGSSIGLFHSYNNYVKFLNQLYEKMNNKGKFILTQRKIEHNIGNGLGKMSNRKKYVLEGFGEYERNYRINYKESHYDFEAYYYVKDNLVHKDVFRMKYFSYEDIYDGLLKVFLAEKIKVYGDYNFSAYSKESTHMVFVCEK